MAVYTFPSIAWFPSVPQYCYILCSTERHEELLPLPHGCNSSSICSIVPPLQIRTSNGKSTTTKTDCSTCCQACASISKARSGTPGPTAEQPLASPPPPKAATSQPPPQIPPQQKQASTTPQQSYSPQEVKGASNAEIPPSNQSIDNDLLRQQEINAEKSGIGNGKPTHRI